MNGSKLMGIVLGLLGVVLLVGGIYYAITYVGAIMNVMIDFFAQNGGAIANCGIGVPDELAQLKDQVATVILPGVYLGIPVAVILTSVIMFAGGYFYGKGALQDKLHGEKRHAEQMEQEVERRVVERKTKTSKKAAPEPEEEEEVEEEE